MICGATHTAKPTAGMACPMSCLRRSSSRRSFAPSLKAGALLAAAPRLVALVGFESSTFSTCTLCMTTAEEDEDKKEEEEGEAEEEEEEEAGDDDERSVVSISVVESVTGTSSVAVLRVPSSRNPSDL